MDSFFLIDQGPDTSHPVVFQGAETAFEAFLTLAN
jgi:hypothetical protein